MIGDDESDRLKRERERMSSCPIDHKAWKENLDPATLLPQDLEESTRKKGNLSKERVTSTIPRGEFCPKHQDPEKGSNWQYPSEQMFFNAMERKGWNPSEKDIPQVVAIHNAVNEQCWRKVLEWETNQNNNCTENPKLIKFQGRPKDLSPKARLKNWFFGYELPFDRHDWIVERCGQERRYIIDFYRGKQVAGLPASVYLDVRPALDSPSALWSRLTSFLFL